MLDPGRMLVLAACAACAVCAGPLAAAPAAALPVEDYRWPGDTLLTQYVTEALLRHPDLSRRDAMVLEADAGKARASAWTNPVLSFGVMDAPTDFRLSEDPMTQKQLGIAQTLPWFTKPVYSRRAAAGRSEAARSYADAERWALRARVAAGYFRLAGLRARAFYLWEALAIADETVSATAAAVASGMDSRAVLLKAEVGRGRISGEISTLRGETEKARWELAAAVGRSEVVSLTDPGPLPAFLPAVNRTALDLEHSPAIRALRPRSRRWRLNTAS